MGRPGVFGVVDPMPHAGNLHLLRQHSLYMQQRIFISLINGKQHFHHFFVGAAVQGPFKGADGAGNGGMHIGKRGCGNPGGKC